MDAQLNSTWKVGYNIGTGFRIPNASEMYFDYRNNSTGAWMSNPNLKAERSLSQAFSVEANHNAGRLSASLHHTRYRDFLYEQETWGEDPFIPGRQRPVQQMQNFDKASIYGIELTGKLNLHNLSTAIPNGLSVFGALGYSKGNLAGDASLLSIQPMKAVIGLDYEQPEGKWGIFSRLTYMGSKKPRDAKYVDLESECDWFGNCTNTREVKPWALLLRM